jgi:hypothetical protein
VIEFNDKSVVFELPRKGEDPSADATALWNMIMAAVPMSYRDHSEITIRAERISMSSVGAPWEEWD